MHIANIFWACVNKIKTNICNFHGNNFTIYNIFFIGWDRYQNRLLYVWLALTCTKDSYICIESNTIVFH